MNQDILFIQKLVSEEFVVPVDDLTGPCRIIKIVPARHCAMYWSKKFTKATLENIGFHFGGRDHASVKHARKRYEEVLYRERKDLCDWVEMLLIERFGDVNYLEKQLNPKWKASQAYKQRRKEKELRLLLNKAA